MANLKVTPYVQVSTCIAFDCTSYISYGRDIWNSTIIKHVPISKVVTCGDRFLVRQTGGTEVKQEYSRDPFQEFLTIPLHSNDLHPSKFGFRVNRGW